MTRPVLTIEIDGINHAAWVRGWKAGALVVACGGRPSYSRTRRAWATSESVARDVVAMAEHDGRHDILIRSIDDRGVS